MNLNLSKTKLGDCEMIQIAGKILSQTEVEELDKEIEVFLEESASKPKLILNLDGLTHINSTGLNHFIRYFTKTRNKGGEMVIINIKPSIMKLLEITKLNSVFTMADNQENAEKILNDL